MRVAVLARIGVLALALVAAAWFAIGVRQARDTSRAASIVSGGAHISASEAHRASDLLSAAAFLNPNRQIDVLRAQVALSRGNEPAARAILKRVVRAEPQYLDAWIWLARASLKDLRDFYFAAYRIKLLVPPVKRSS